MFNAEFFLFLYRLDHFFLGIFAYLNFCVPRKRKYILELLISGLQRLEYRGYDSAGSCVLFGVLFTVFLLLNPKSFIVLFYFRSGIRWSWKDEVILASGFRISRDGAKSVNSN